MTTPRTGPGIPQLPPGPVRDDLLLGLRGWQKNAYHEYFKQPRRDFLLVATKSDRLSNNQRNSALRTLEDEYPVARLLPYSAKTSAGRDELWSQIRQAARLSNVAAASS